MPAGVRPTNTLTKTNHSRQQHDKKQRPPTLLEDGTSQFLHLEKIRGNNVRQPLITGEGDISELPPRKRQKTESKFSKLDNSSVSSDALDGVDPNSVGENPVILLSRDCRRSSQTRSGHGQSQLIIHSGSAVNGHVREYQKVEARMRSDLLRSNPTTRENGRPWGDPSHDSKSAVLPIAGASTVPNLIDLCDDETLEKTPNDIPCERREQSIKDQSGLMREEIGQGEIPQSQPQSTATRSRHFLNTNTSERSNNIPRTPLLSTSTHAETQKEEPRLNDQFRAMDGKRRNQEYSSSPDELAGDPDLEISQASFLPKLTSRGTNFTVASTTKSSSSTRKGSPTNESLGGLAPSSVPISTFSRSSANKAPPGTSVRKNREIVESSPSWGAPLAAVNAGGKILSSPSLGLQLNPRTDSYEVMNEGRKIVIDSIILQIQPQKLQKVAWSRSRPQVRFWSSKSVDCDPVLDIELRSAKDCQVLLSRLQNACSHNLHVESKEGQVRPCEDSQCQPLTFPRDYLDKAFQKRLSEQMKSQSFKSSRAVDEGEDLSLAARNKANRITANSITDFVKPTSTKRRRVSRNVDQLQIGKEEVEAPHPALSTRSSSLDTPKDQSVLDGGVSPSRISEITQSLQPKKQSTYSTRSHMTSNFGANAVRSPSQEAMPAQKRYQIQDFGEPWRKPLVYPRDGKKKSTVEWLDLERLNEGEFFNDTLISFYLRYLEQKCEERNPEMAKRIYFFNSFFYASLTKTQRGKKGINYEAVQKWTRGMDIFNCDFVVVPINESLHWYFAVICNLPSLKRDFSHLDDDAVVPPIPSTDRVPTEVQATRTSYPISGSSNLLASGAAIQSAIVDQSIIKSTEEDARSSFAELSLDNEEQPDERAMLDGQVDSEEAQASNHLSKQEAQSQANARKHMAAVGASVEPESPLAASSSKKRKRKSFPPGKKLDPTEPAIVTFDSLAVAHSPTVRILKDYLKAEAHEKRSMIFDDSQIKGMTAVGIPKQDNYCDCGPYLLGYMDRFLEDPKGFIEKTMRKKLDLEKDWPRLDPSNLRSGMRDLLLDLHKEQEDGRKLSTRKPDKVQTSQKPNSSPRKDHPNETKRDGVALVARMSEEALLAAQSGLRPASTYETKYPTLQHTLKVDDEADRAEIPVPRKRSEDGTKASVSTLEESHPVVVVDSQPAESQSPVQPTAVTPISALQAEGSSVALPSTIQDSQPQEIFQSLEDSQHGMTGTPTPHSERISLELAATSPVRTGTVYSPPLVKELSRQYPQQPEVSAKSQLRIEI